MFNQRSKHRKKRVLLFTTLPPVNIFLLEIVKSILFEGICDGVLFEAAESFEDEDVTLKWYLIVSVCPSVCFVVSTRDV